MNKPTVVISPQDEEVLGYEWDGKTALYVGFRRLLHLFGIHYYVPLHYAVSDKDGVRLVGDGEICWFC